MSECVQANFSYSTWYKYKLFTFLLYGTNYVLNFTYTWERVNLKIRSNSQFQSGGVLQWSLLWAKHFMLGELQSRVTSIFVWLAVISRIFPSLCGQRENIIKHLSIPWGPANLKTAPYPMQSNHTAFMSMKQLLEQRHLSGRVEGTNYEQYVFELLSTGVVVSCQYNSCSTTPAVRYLSSAFTPASRALSWYHNPPNRHSVHLTYVSQAFMHSPYTLLTYLPQWEALECPKWIYDCGHVFFWLYDCWHLQHCIHATVSLSVCHAFAWDKGPLCPQLSSHHYFK